MRSTGPAAATTQEYDRLLARQDAMALRRSLFSAPGAHPLGSGPRGRALEPAYPPGQRERDQALLTAHLSEVGPIHELIAELYRHLFRRGPYLRPLFPASLQFQQDRLTGMFTFLIANLTRPETIAQTCRSLGRDHRKLGVRPVHYEMFEAALIDALRTRAADGWTAELERAWRRLLAPAVSAMTEGARSTATEPPYWNATVIGHEHRGDDVAVIWVQASEPYPYRAGQYARLESPHLPHAWRPFTVACAPDADNVLEFHVRRGRAGGLAQVLVDHTRTGDRLRLGPAQGTLTLDRDWNGPVLLTASGTGWAAAKALLEQLVAQGRAQGRALLLIAADTRRDLYDWRTVADLSARHPCLDVVPVLADSGWPGEDGTLADALTRQGPLTDRLAYLCGPAPATAAVAARLRDLGVPEERIRWDTTSGLSEPTSPSGATRTERDA